jgi:uncharacterized protein with GYD domain
MTRYLYEVGLSPQFFASCIKNPSDRAEAIRPLYDAIGAKLEAYYFGAGSTAYVVVEYPSTMDVDMQALGMAMLATGALTSLKLISTLLTAAEAIEAMRKAGSIGYKPPSS